MKVISLSAVILLFCIACQLCNAIGFIEGYQIDDGTTIDTTDCEIYTSSITVINCPSRNSYDVILTEMMVNGTVAEIENKIEGVPDDVMPQDTRVDKIRRVSVTDTTVEFIQKSQEKEDGYHGAFVVVTNKGGSFGQYQVTRYWKNRDTNWVESEHMFDLLGGPYTNLFLFDGYAITVQND